MFHRALLALALVASLSGCDTDIPLSEKIKQVQAKAVQLCSYLPQANAVAAMLTASNPAIVGIVPIANAICTAVTAWQTKQGTKEALATECPRVNGVCVEGTFVQTPKGSNAPKGE